MYMSLALGPVLGLGGHKDPEIISLLFPVDVIAIFSQVLTQKGKNRDAQSQLTVSAVHQRTGDQCS